MAKRYTDKHTDRNTDNKIPTKKQALMEKKKSKVDKSNQENKSLKKAYPEKQKEKSSSKKKVTKAINKTIFPKPGNFLYPVPAVMVSCADENGKPNIITIAWAGTVCSDPPMVSISVRKSRYSYDLIKNSREFVINLTDRKLAKAADFCGVRSGKDVDKFKVCHLTAKEGSTVKAPLIAEAPVNIECRVTQVLELGSHDMFLAEVTAVQVDSKYIDEKNSFHMEDVDLIAYSHGKYQALGDILGTFGYSVRKKN